MDEAILGALGLEVLGRMSPSTAKRVEGFDGVGSIRCQTHRMLQFFLGIAEKF